MLLLATEIWKSHGGVQRYMRMISRICSNQGEEFVILALLDSEEHRPHEFEEASAITCNGSKWKFGVEAFRLSRAIRN